MVSGGQTGLAGHDKMQARNIAAAQDGRCKVNVA